MIVIPYDPVHLICEAAHTMWPDMKCTVEYVDTEKTAKLTIPTTSDDHPVIMLPTGLGVEQCKAELAHRLAAIAVGGKTEDNPEYERCVLALVERYNQLFDAIHGTPVRDEESVKDPSNVIHYDFVEKKKLARPAV